MPKLALVQLVIPAICLLSVISLGVSRLQRDRTTSEERAFWEANGLKVKEGWDKGFASGKELGQRRAAENKFSMPTRELSNIAHSSRATAGIEDEVISSSYRRGFIFGFYTGLKKPDESGY